MGETIVDECRECGAEVRIDSASLNFIASASGLDREELLLCDEHLEELIGEIHLDLGMGTTSDAAFEAQRERRQQDAGERADAQQSTPVNFEYVYETTHPQEGTFDAIAIDLPKEAKPDLKEMSQPLTRAAYDDDEERWRIKADALSDVVEHLQAAGWDTRLGPDVKRHLEG